MELPGIYRAAAGAASWDSHPRMVLMWLPSLLEAVTGQKYHCTLLLFIARNNGCQPLPGILLCDSYINGRIIIVELYALGKSCLAYPRL